MKVLHLSKYYPPVWGGIESVVYNFVEYNNRVVQNEVYCFNNDGVKSEEILCFKPFFIFQNQPLSLRYIIQFIRHHREYDIIHIHLPNYVALLCVALVRISSVTIVIHWHSDVLRKSRLLISILGGLERYVLRKASVIVATSLAYKESSKVLSRYDNVKAIPLSLPKFKTVNNYITTSQVTGAFIIVARLVPYKGILEFIDAFTLIEEATLVIVGSGPLEKEVNDRIKLYQLEDRVRMEKGLSYSDLIIEMSKASVLCLPSVSRQEAFGVVLLEAMRIGLRLLVTNVHGSGMVEICENSFKGIVVEQNKRSIYQGLKYALDSSPEELKEISRKNRLIFESRYSNEAIFPKWNKLYTKIINS